LNVTLAAPSVSFAFALTFAVTVTEPVATAWANAGVEHTATTAAVRTPHHTAFVMTRSLDTRF
jgi:hypothetical protein